MFAASMEHVLFLPTLLSLELSDSLDCVLRPSKVFKGKSARKAVQLALCNFDFPSMVLGQFFSRSVH
jgi:hypothetical protein